MLILEAQERIHAIWGSQQKAEVKESAKKTIEGPNDGNKIRVVPNFLEEHAENVGKHSFRHIIRNDMNPFVDW